MSQPRFDKARQRRNRLRNKCFTCSEKNHYTYECLAFISTQPTSSVTSTFVSSISVTQLTSSSSTAFSFVSFNSEPLLTSTANELNDIHECVDVSNKSSTVSIEAAPKKLEYRDYALSESGEPVWYQKLSDIEPHTPPFSITTSSSIVSSSTAMSSIIAMRRGPPPGSTWAEMIAYRDCAYCRGKDH